MRGRTRPHRAGEGLPRSEPRGRLHARVGERILTYEMSMVARNADGPGKAGAAIS